MALLFMDGFDDRATGSDSLNEKGWTQTGNPQIVASEGRFGTQCYRGSSNQIAKKTIDHTDPTTFWGLAIKPWGAPGGAQDGIMYLWGDTGTVNHITINKEADGSLSVRRGDHDGTELGRTADLDWQEGVYFYIEIKILIHDSAGTIDIWKNGVNVLTDTGLDTKNGGTNSYIDEIHIQGSPFWFYGDDFYIGDTIGTEITDVVGDVHVETLFPDTEGGLIEFTPSTGADNSDTIDENPATNDTDYNSDSTPGNIDRMNMDHVADASLTIHGIQVASWAQKSDSGTIQFRHNILSDASVGTGVDHALGTGFGWFWDMFELDPDGSVAWTGAQLDAAQIGYETRT